MDFNNLSAQEKEVLSQLFAKASQTQSTQPIDASQSVPSADNMSPAQPAQAPQQAPQTPELQQQPGDKMHPMDAINHISGMMQQGPLPSQPANMAPKLVMDNGQLAKQVPRDTALGRLFFKTKNEKVTDPTNYYDTLVGMMGQSGADKVLPGNVSQDPNGHTWVSKDQFDQIVKAKSMLPSSNNPPVSLKDALTESIITQHQYDEFTKQGLKPEDTKNLNEWRLGVLGRTATAKEGQLGVARNSLESRLGLNFQRDISDAEQRVGTPMGTAAMKLQNSVLARQSLSNRYNADTDSYDLNSTEFGDLAIAAAKSLNSTGVLSNEQIDAIKQASLKGDFGRLATYLTGVNFQGSTQDIIRRLVSLVDREGLASEQARNLYAQQNMPAHDALKRINPDYYNSILNKAYGGISYSQLLADSKDTQSPNYILPNITPLTRTPAPGQSPPPPVTPVRPPQTPTAPVQSPTAKTPVKKSLKGLVIH